MPDNNSLEVMNLSSMSGIIVVTMFIIEILKRALGHIAAFNKVPVFLYAILISALLALLANKVLKTNDGSPMLEGSVFKVIWASIMTSLGASGFYTWLRGQTPLRDSNKLGGGTVVPVALALLVLTGCCEQEKQIIIGSLDQGSLTVRTQMKEWVPLMGADPELRKQLPTLTPAQQLNFMTTIDDFEDTLELYKQPKDLFGRPVPQKVGQ